MSDEALGRLAQAAGLMTRWTDYRSREREVSPATLRRILAALELPAETPQQIADSQARLADEAGGRRLPPMLLADAGRPCALPAAIAPDLLRLEYESGEAVDLAVREEGGARWLPPVTAPGYHRLHVGDEALTLAVAPAHCLSLGDIAPRRLWGVAAQLYALRRAGDFGVGDFGALTEFARSCARGGADALAISPVHALFGADVQRFSPYAPSSRLFLNSVHADPLPVFGEALVQQVCAELGLEAERRRLEAEPLVDWPAAASARHRLLRALYGHFGTQRRDALSREFREFVKSGGTALEQHARFEALHAEQFAAGRWHWRDWPAELRDPDSAEVARFAKAHADEVRFQLFLQWLADRGLRGAQQAAREAGMKIGLIADLAVGTDSGGSHGWSRQQDMLAGLSVGAPPDDLNALGQNWGLTAFSPRALRLHGYAPFIELLRASLRSVGGLRIDHVLGLRRLWLVPDGAREGAYLLFPFEDMLRLVALESWRHHALIIGEDLGTLPEGFRERLEASGILGLRVLWFQRDHGLFIDPSRWTPHALATTTTHDLPTAAGWWRGRDLDWRARLNLFAPEHPEAGERAQRDQDRRTLWAAYQHNGVAQGPPPPPEQPQAAVDAAVQFVARTAAPLAIVPAEDLLGLDESPNLPGTTDEHPNWRRRLPPGAAAQLQTPEAQRRMDLLRRERG